MRVIDTSNMKRKKLCNHKSIDGKLCPEERQPMSGGMFRSKCKVHFAASNVASKQRLATKRLQDDDPENLELMETKLRIQSAIRMQACRAARLKGLESIRDLNVRRIATILDTIKNSKNYVIVPNAIADIVNISNISLAGSPQGIAFSGGATVSEMDATNQECRLPIRYSQGCPSRISDVRPYSPEAPDIKSW